MTRPTLQIVIFLVLLNLSAGLITASGLGAALDINPEVIDDGKTDDTLANASEVRPNQGQQDTLFSLFTSTAGKILDVIKLVGYGPMMLRSIGIPEFITDFLFGAAAIIVAADVIHYLTGRG